MPDNRLGILRIQLDGQWTVEEMSQLFANLSSSYVSLNAFIYISDSFDQRIRSFSGLNPRWFKHDFPYPLPPSILLERDLIRWIEPLVHSALRESSDLYLHGIELHSPGWLEVLGRLNPLRAIEETIKAWRAENLKRMKNESQERIELRKLESQERLETLKVKSDVFTQITNRADQLRRDGTSPLMEQYISLTSDQPIRQIEQLAKDPRIVVAEIVSENGDSEIPHPDDFPEEP